jgi:hypothetical protein
MNKIITNFPMFRKLSTLFSPYIVNNMDRSSPFRLPYENIIKNPINTYCLNKLSRFNPVDIARIIPNRLDVSYSYKGSRGDLNLLLRKNLLYLKGVIYNFTSNYSNLTCSINLTYYGQKIRIDTIIKNGHLESFNLQRTNLDLAKSSKYTNYFYESSMDKIKELLRLTEPCKVGSDLQVFTGEASSFFNNNFQQYHSIEETFNEDFQQDIYPIEKPSSQNKGKKRMFESYDTEHLQSKDKEYDQPKQNTVEAEMALFD